MLRTMALVAAFVFTAPLFGQEAQPPVTPAEKQTELDRTAPVLLARYDVPSVGVAYIENGEIAFVRHYGFQTWGYPANEETLYNVASLTKPITAEVVLRLIEEGHLTLATPLADHHTEDDVADDPRIRQLTPELVMRHRTGFPNWRYQTDGVLTFSHDPDTETQYSGEGYEWLLKAAQAAAGEDFETSARRLLFDPAQMKFTSYTRTKYFPYRTAAPYKAGEAVYDVIRTEPTASDDARTTAREYAQFVLDVFEGDRISETLRTRQSTIVHSSHEHPQCDGSDGAPAFCPQNEGWGLGWFIHDYGDRKILQHSGGDQGEASLAIYDPVAKRGVVALTNGAEGHRVMTRVVGQLFGDPRVEEYFVSLSDGIGN